MNFIQCIQQLSGLVSGYNMIYCRYRQRDYRTIIDIGTVSFSKLIQILKLITKSFILPKTNFPEGEPGFVNL
jgi:hypothetical protein